MELDLSWEVIMQLIAGKEEAKEKVERVTKYLRCECLTLFFTCAALDACLAYGCFFVEYRHQAHAQFKVFGD